MWRVGICCINLYAQILQSKLYFHGIVTWYYQDAKNIEQTVNPFDFRRFYIITVHLYTKGCIYVVWIDFVSITLPVNPGQVNE